MLSWYESYAGSDGDIRGNVVSFALCLKVYILIVTRPLPRNITLCQAIWRYAAYAGKSCHAYVTSDNLRRSIEFVILVLEMLHIRNTSACEVSPCERAFFKR